MKNKREMVKATFRGEKLEYTPWQMGFTIEAKEKLKSHYGDDYGDYYGDYYAEILDNHFCSRNIYPDNVMISEDLSIDFFGVTWDRSEDKDIGVVVDVQLPEPTLENYTFPDKALVKKHVAEQWEDMKKNANGGFRIFDIGFSLFERAWTLRGMENLLMDFILNPEFVHELLHEICNYNIAALEEIIDKDIDAVYFGDDWGQQRGLIMGPKIWREFIKPELKRIYSFVKSHNKKIVIHSCGDVQELFDDLIEMGLDCFNPFQPEVMDVHELHEKYRGKLSFWGGLSTQKTLPYGTVDDVKSEVKALLEMGRNGNYIFSPAHAVEGDVPLENLIAMIETVTAQI